MNLRYTLAAIMLSAAMPAQAATNLVDNGGFEQGLAGWHFDGTDGVNNPPVAISYDLTLPPDNSATLSPDGAGTRALYFTSDLASPQLLSRFVTLSPGKYVVGLSTYVPAGSLRSPGSASFRAIFLGITVADFELASRPGGTWEHFSTTISKSTTGTGSINLSFAAGPDTSPDILVDRVYISAVPEPESWALLVAGLAAAGLMRRRSARQAASH